MLYQIQIGQILELQDCDRQMLIRETLCDHFHRELFILEQMWFSEKALLDFSDSAAGIMFACEVLSKFTSMKGSA